MGRARNDPPMVEIYLHWRMECREDPDAIYDMFPAFAIDPGEPSCFACGWRIPELREFEDDIDAWGFAGHFLERGHLMDHALGGSNDPSNYVPICRPCHRQMSRETFCVRSAAVAWVASHERCNPWFQFRTDNTKALRQEGNRHYILLDMWKEFESTIKPALEGVGRGEEVELFGKKFGPIDLTGANFTL